MFRLNPQEALRTEPGRVSTQQMKSFLTITTLIAIIIESLRW